MMILCIYLIFWYYSECHRITLCKNEYLYKNIDSFKIDYIIKFHIIIIYSRIDDKEEEDKCMITMLLLYLL